MPHPFRSVRRVSVVALAVLALGACGDKKPSATQAAAKVNGTEITVHQVNQLLNQQPGLRQEDVPQVSRTLLERLIEQQLALDQAKEEKVDRDARVQAAVEANRRDIVSLAYAERVIERAPKLTEADLKAYFDRHPALYAKRHQYTLVEVNVQGEPAQLDAALQRAKATARPAEFADWLRASGLRGNVAEAWQPSDALPLALVDELSRMSVGEMRPMNLPGGLKLTWLVAATPAPWTFEQARAAIEERLTQERRSALVAADLQRLRASAKVEYLGQFAQGAPAPAAVAAPAASAPASGALDAQTLKKGLGLN